MLNKDEVIGTIKRRVVSQNPHTEILTLEYDGKVFEAVCEDMDNDANNTGVSLTEFGYSQECDQYVKNSNRKSDALYRLIYSLDKFAEQLYRLDPRWN